MSRRGGTVSRYSDIKNLKELREARREVDFAGRSMGARLADDAREAFSWENLLSIIAPRGSVANRLLNGAGMGVAVVKGILGYIRSFRGGGGC